ncbi:MFS general substrate transporter [Stipitochalara longipes BDJ]|nr:MFS general substrate transporter [Stipitochalara longipes BDJ]
MTAPDSSLDQEDEEDAPLLPDLMHMRTHTPTGPFYQTRSRRIITLIIFAVIFILAFGGTLMVVPSIRLYEDIVCHHYYNGLEGNDHRGYDDTIEEGLCKVREVQQELNILFAGMHFLGAFVSLVTAVPYGLLADRIGRRPVFLLAVYGLFLANLWSLVILRFWRYLPVRLLWLNIAFTLIGGGEAVATMMFYAIGSDVTPQEKRANVFLIGGGMVLFGEILAPSISSFLMAKSPWIPLLIGQVLIGLGPALFISVPETLHMRPRGNESGTLTPDDVSEQSVSINEADKPGFLSAAISQAMNSLKEVYGSLSVLHSLPILLLLLAFLIQPFSRQSVDLSLRYVSNRFHWDLKNVGFLLSLRALVNFLLLLALLPSLSYYLIKRLHFSSKEKDLALARLSVVFLVIGALLIGLSPTIVGTIIGHVVFTLGTGTNALTRSLITSLVDQEHVGRLYAAIGVVEVCGSLVASPTLAALYTLGLRLQGPWVGLPFLVLALICFVGAIGIWTFGCLSRDQLPRREEEEDDANTLVVIPDSVEGGVINVV